MTQQLDEAEVAKALNTAALLAHQGVPIFLATWDHERGDFIPPTGWQNTEPDPTVVNQWRPELALCAVTGCGLDVIDVDPRNGGELGALIELGLPTSYGLSTTPSGGAHSYIRSLGIAKHTNVWPGIDVQAGTPDGTGRGFVFLPPTIRYSKADGQPTPYRWTQPLDVQRWWDAASSDRSGVPLADHIRSLRADSVGMHKIGGPDWWRRFLQEDRPPQSWAAADQAIEAKLREVSTWDTGSGQGFRNALLRAALTLGGYVGSGWLDEQEARDRLAEAAEQAWGAPADADDLRWIDQGIEDGKASPFYVYTAEQEREFAATDPGDPGDQRPPWSIYDSIGRHAFDPATAFHHQEMAEHILTRTAPIMAYAADVGRWIIRKDPESWSFVPGDLSDWLVTAVTPLMPPGDPDVPKKPEDRTPEHWRAVRRKQLLNNSAPIEKKIRAAMKGPSVHNLNCVDLRRLDHEQEILWAGGVPWDLNTCRPAAIDPDTPHLHTALCAPAEVPTPFWDDFLAAVWPDKEIRAWALRVLSISLTGYPDAALPVLYGPPRNGKTSLISLLVDLLGTYGIAADPRLLAGTDTAHASIIYALKGARLAFIDEGPRKGHLATERLKQLTGGGKLTGNAMRADPVTFNTTHTLVMTTNDEPPITDEGLRARMRIIPCDGDQSAVRRARQALTSAVWQQEAPGVLAMLMRECSAWLADRDSASTDRGPATLRELEAEMAADQNPIHEWVENCTVPADPGTPGRELYHAYLAWAEAKAAYRRNTQPSESTFGAVLTKLGHLPSKQGGKKWRPLSVLFGSSGYLPVDPPRTHSAPVDHGQEAWTPAAEDRVSSGCPAEVSRDQNSSSDLVFSSSSGHLDTSHTTTDTQIEQPPPPHTTLATEKPGTGCPVSKVSRVSGETPEPAATGPSEVARRAAEEGITKAEARRRIKAEEREQAIAQTLGETVDLPAVVDRAGHTIPVTQSQAEAVVNAALRRTGGTLTVDVETSGFPVGHRHFVLKTVQLGDGEASVVLRPVEDAEVIRRLLGAASKLHAHSATADLVPLATTGLIEADSAWERMYDTTLPALLADPQSTGSDSGLKKLAPAVLGAEATVVEADAGRGAAFKAARWLTEVKPDDPPERSGWLQIPRDCATMVRYAASDVLDTAALAQRLPAIPEALIERERAFQRMTARITHRGLPLDYEQIRSLASEHTALKIEAGEKIQDLAPSDTPIENPGSGPQVAAALLALGADLPLTPTGKPSAAEHAVSALAKTEGHPAAELAEAILTYRHSATILSLFVETYRPLCEYGDGRVRPTIYTLGTNTGRCSSVRPNAQQLSKKGGVRAIYRADPGHVLISADFSGVELRGAAALSQDQTMMHAIAEEDAGRFDGFHWAVARQAFGPDATKEHRYMAKAGVFGYLYGGGVATLARQLGITQATMQAIVDALRTMTPGLSAWGAQLRNSDVKHFMSYSGRAIWLPQDYRHKWLNYAVQGTCRELLVDAALEWSKTRWGTATLLPVHDELLLQVPEDDAEEALDTLLQCMTGELYGVEIVATPNGASPFWKDSV